MIPRKIFMVFTVVSSLSHAQTFTWDGGGSDDNFGTGANWNPNGAPSVGSGVVLNFTGSTRTTPYNNYTVGDNFGEWRLNSGAGADFTISGNTFGLYSKIEVDSGAGRNLTLNTGSIVSRDGSFELNPVGGNLTLGSSATVELDGNATLNVYDGNFGRTLTLNGALSNGNGSGGNGSLILNQTSTVILTGANDYGNTTLNNNTTLQIGNGGTTGTLGSGTTSIGSGAVLRFQHNMGSWGATATTYTGTISGAGSVTQAGLGSVTLGGNNSYSGGTSVTNGRLRADHSSAFGSGTVTVSDGAAAFLVGSGTYANAWNLTGRGADEGGTYYGALRLNDNLTINGNITLNASANPVRIRNEAAENLSAPATLNGVISGSGGLAKTGTGTIRLTNTGNTFSGDIRIQQGTLQTNSDAQFGNSANGIVFDGGTFQQYSGAALSIAGTRTLSATAGNAIRLHVWGGGSITVNGPVTGASAIGLIKTDGGTLNLNGALSFAGYLDNQSGTVTLSNTSNSYTGYTHIRGGTTIRLDASNVVPNTSTVLMYGGTFNVNGQTETIGSLTTGSSGDTGASVTLGAGSLTVTSNSLPSGMTSGYSNATWHGNISGTGSVTYNQSSGTGVDWTLATSNSYSGGTSVLAGRIRAQNTGAFGSGAVTVGDGGAVYLVASGSTFASNFSLTGRGANESGSYNGALRVAGNEDVSGQITLNTSANQARIRNDAGEDLGGGGMILSGKVTGSGGFEKTGPGTLRLTNTTNDFTGNITISEGTVQTNADSQFGNASNGIVFNGGTFQQYGGAALTIGSGRTLSATAGNAIRLHVWGGGSITVNGPVTGASAAGLRKTDGGQLTLANTGNNYAASSTNPYTLIEAGELRLAASEVIPNNSIVVLYNASSPTFNLNGNTETVAALHSGSSGDTASVVQLGSGGNLIVTGTADASGIGDSPGNYYGQITGTGNITYNHATNAQANWYWHNSSNNFAGNVTISSGRLNVSEASLGNAANDIIFNGDVVATLNNGEGKASLQQNSAATLTLNAGRTITLNTGKEGTLYVWSGQTTEVLGQITGGGNLRKEDGGTLRLSNTSNNYTGQTKLALGTLTLGAAGVLPDATEVVVANATLNLNGFNETVSALSSGGFTNGIITGNGGTLFVNGSGNYTYTGRITDAIGGANNGGIVAYNGTGSLTLAGTADNSGGRARVDNGTLILAKTSTGSVHAVGTNNTPALFINGGTLQLGGTGGDQIYTEANVQMAGGTFDLNARSEGFRGLSGAAGTIVNNGGGTSALLIGESSTSGDTYTFSGTFGTGSGTLNLVKRGGGIQVLDGTSPFTGTVTVMDGGTLSVPVIANTGVAQPLGAGATPLELQAGSSLLFTGATGATNRGLLLTGVNGGIVNVATGTLTQSGSITGSSANFTKSGSGTFNFSGSGSWSGDFNVSGGTFNLTGGGAIAGVGVTTVSGTLNINTSSSMQTASLDILSGGAVSLDAGTLRVGGGGLGVTGRSIDNAGGSFTWGNGTLAVYTTGSGEAGLTDRANMGGSPSGPEVKEGNYLSVAGSLTASAGSTLDLGSTYLSNGLRYNQINVDGNLTLNNADLNIGLSPYFLRPNSPSSVVVGDWGTMVLVYAEGTLAGTFSQVGGKTVIPGIGSDNIGWTQLADIVYTGGGSPFDPSTLNLNEWVIEYRDGSGGNGFNFTQSPGGAVLLHYKVAGSVPEPASAGLLVAGTLLLRALRRRA